jgi:hypothetical protein
MGLNDQDERSLDTTNLDNHHARFAAVLEPHLTECSGWVRECCANRLTFLRRFPDAALRAQVVRMYEEGKIGGINGKKNKTPVAIQEPTNTTSSSIKPEA